MEKIFEHNGKVKILAEMPERFRIVRDNFLKNFESRSEGLDMERVQNFLLKHQLPVEDIVMYRQADLAKINEMLDGIYEFDKHQEACFSSELNLVFVKRNEVCEKLNGHLYDEGTLVHELAHGSNAHRHFVENITTGETISPRVGFALGDGVQSYGDFLEEGFADLMRGEYVAEFREEKKDAEISRRRKYFGKDLFDWVEKGFPNKYAYLDNCPEGVSIGVASIAAVGLEMLMEKIPELKQVMIEARSDIEKLREIPKLINSIRPGLYLELQRHAYDPEEFIKAKNLIKEAIENL